MKHFDAYGQPKQSFWKKVLFWGSILFGAIIISLGMALTVAWYARKVAPIIAESIEIMFYAPGKK